MLLGPTTFCAAALAVTPTRLLKNHRHKTDPQRRPPQGPELKTARLGDGVLLGPLSADALRVLLVLLVVLRDVGRERVVRVRRAEERLDRKQHGADLECWGPFVCGERG